MNIQQQLRDLVTGTDRRVKFAGAALLTTALIGGLAYAAPNESTADRMTDASDSVELATPTGNDAGDSVELATPTSNDSNGSATPTAVAPTAVAPTAVAPTAVTPTTVSSTTGTPTGNDASDSVTPTAVTPTAATPTTVSSTTGTPTGNDASDSATPTTASPLSDADEPESGPDAGQVIPATGVTEQPSHPTYQPSMTVVALDPVEDEGLPPAATPPVPVSPLFAPSGGLVSNVYGCAATCIVHAELQSSAFSPDLSFDLETNVTTSSGIWVTTQQPIIDEGEIIVEGWPTYFGVAWLNDWQTIIELEYDANYWLTLRVEDTQGNLEWAINEYSTGPAPTPDQIAASGEGCYFQCINLGNVEFTDSYERVDLVIGTDLPATEDVLFDVAVSTSEPGWVGDSPLLPTQHTFVVDQDGGNDVRGHVSGLAPSTKYHVVVKATDEAGYRAHAIGTFTTDPEPPTVPTDVRVSWERFFVHYDGDAGAWGRGEISFAWGVADGGGNPNWLTPYTSYGARNEEKISDNTSIVLGEGNHHWVSVYQGETLPPIAVTAHENDTHGNVSYEQCLGYRQATYDSQRYDSTCMTRTNVAAMSGLTIADTQAFPECSTFDVPADKANDRCLVIKSLDANDQHAQFDALISFRIAN
jgi:hypothetical protein